VIGIISVSLILKSSLLSLKPKLAEPEFAEAMLIKNKAKTTSKSAVVF
jgi:hypothetical protein